MHCGGLKQSVAAQQLKWAIVTNEMELDRAWPTEEFEATESRTRQRNKIVGSSLPTEMRLRQLSIGQTQRAIRYVTLPSTTSIPKHEGFEGHRIEGQ